MIIEKKIWPDRFEKIKNIKKHFEIRLADFKIKKRDILILNEWNHKTKRYTGRKLKFKTGLIFKIPKDSKKFYSEADMKKYGFYIIELKK
jgi:hypothetical protein